MTADPLAVPRLTARFALDLFLRQLTRTGNFAFSAELTGLAKSGLYKRRARDPDFASACRRALQDHREELSDQASFLIGTGREPGLTSAGDLAFSRYANKPQLRRLPPGRLTSEGIGEFLRVLARTANVRLAARHVGVAHSSIYRRRKSDPAFARDMDAALDVAAVELECGLLQAADRGFTPRTDWLDGIEEDRPKMTVQEALWYLRRREGKRGG